MAEALDYAHGRGVIHRDIRPANILLQSGKPVVADFGVALAVSAGSSDRLTETGLSVGTAVFARAFDLRTLELRGDAVPRFDGVRIQSAWVDMRLAANGTLLYVEGGGGSLLSSGSELVTMGLDGTEEPLLRERVGG